MKNLFLLWLWITIAVLVTACHSGRKFDYSSAYRFQTPKAVSHAPGPQATALIEDNTVSTSASVVIEPNATITGLPVDGKYSESGPAEIHPQRSIREIRQTLKSYKKELKTIYRAKKPITHQSDQKVNDGYFLRGLVLLILGLVAIVLSIMFFNSLGTVLAAIIAAVGLILFLMGLLGLIL